MEPLQEGWRAENYILSRMWCAVCYDYFAPRSRWEKGGWSRTFDEKRFNTQAEAQHRVDELALIARNARRRR